MRLPMLLLLFIIIASASFYGVYLQSASQPAEADGDTNRSLRASGDTNQPGDTNKPAGGDTNQPARAGGYTNDIVEKSRMQMHEAIFETLYASQGWSLTEDTLSGPGSSTNATGTACSVLQTLLTRIINSGKSRVKMLDAPMGDFWWQSHCLKKFAAQLAPGVEIIYQGVDVSMIAAQRAEKRRANWTVKAVALRPFMQMDLVEKNVLSKTFGNSSFDVVLCNDALMHNNDFNVQRILSNFNEVAEYLVVNSYLMGGDVNVDIPMNLPGGKYPYPFRRLDLTRIPYCLQPTCADEEMPGMRNLHDQGEYILIYKLPLPNVTTVHKVGECAEKRLYRTCLENKKGGGFNDSFATFCGWVGRASCPCDGDVRFGGGRWWFTKRVTVGNPIDCTEEAFGGDPFWFADTIYINKHCECVH